MELVDTHAHLDDEAFAGDLPAVLTRAAEAGVGAVVAIGTDSSSSRQIVALAERYPSVYACPGIHPHEAGTAGPEAVRALADWTVHPRVVAVGETGLDYYREFAPRPAQAALFRAHLELAGRSGLPVVIHCRDAYPDVLAILDEFPGVTCIFHAFSGSPQVAGECARRGHYLSFAGPLTFPGVRRPVEVARVVPLERVLLETDAPHLSPHPFRGRRNEPARVRVVAERLAAVRGITLEEVAAATTANALRVFRLGRVEARA